MFRKYEYEFNLTTTVDKLDALLLELETTTNAYVQYNKTGWNTT